LSSSVNSPALSPSAGGEGSASTLLPEPVHQEVQRRLKLQDFPLPLLPEVTTRVIQLTASEDVDLRAVNDLVHRDQSMAGHLLRIANSALYAPSCPIVSLRQAIDRLGAMKVREIALVIAASNRIFRVAGWDAEVRVFFRHALAVGIFAQEISRLRRCNVEEGFLAGLLHSAGKPVLIQLITDAATKTKLKIERDAVLGYVDQNHSGIGARMIRAWKLPDSLADCLLAFQTAHEVPTSPESARAVNLSLAFAPLALQALGNEQKAEAEECVRSHPVLWTLSLYPEDINELLTRVDAIKEQIQQISA
jgi:HD-like signal output (HDOD) protein